MIEELLKKEELAALGKRLQSVRDQLGLKQKQLAAELGLSASYLSEIEKGKTNPGFIFLLKLCRKYKISLDWLIFNEGDMFLGEKLKAKGKLLDIDFGDQTGLVIEMLELMKISPFFLNHFLGQYIKSTLENESTIKKDLEKHKPKE